MSAKHALERVDSTRLNVYCYDMERRSPYDPDPGTPEPTVEQQAFVSIQRAADRLAQEFAALVKESGLTMSQYNVLQILRGAGTDGLLCHQVGSRMITREPDMTRLLDRMQKVRLVTRSRDRKDRRAVSVRISSRGLDILNSLDIPVQTLHTRQFSKISPEAMQDLMELLLHHHQY